MNESVSKHRKKLNAGQLEVLDLLYKFRFGTNDLFARYFGKKDRSFVYKRLLILLEQGLVGKRFESSYRLQGKPAAYYLTPEGARALQERRKPDDDVINIKAIYKDKTVKDDFVRHCLDVFAIYNRLKAQYGDRLKLFTKADLNYERFDYFPQPLPDAYIRLRLGGEDKQFFLDIYYDSQPFFAAVRKIKKYADYAESGEWEETVTDLPKILAVCESSSLQKRLQKRMVTPDDDKLVFVLARRAKLLGEATVIWCPAADPDEAVTLQAIQ